jgi:hypothetical protein
LYSYLYNLFELFGCVQAKLPTVLEVEEEKKGGHPSPPAERTKQDLELESKLMPLADPLDSIFALAYKNIESS